MFKKAAFEKDAHNANNSLVYQNLIISLDPAKTVFHTTVSECVPVRFPRNRSKEFMRIAFYDLPGLMLIKSVSKKIVDKIWFEVAN